eukprot:CAMPEP_0180810192 /NCGR_PEP_ID=MMETSP1038_2-20121128/64749_1 /TAXON_ID=632150 /ORGANISM="Azadinium spinosum, Strain 3D9" /LENGTH=150 /DNA_ID=CAMNT_0022851457 /DNA_START=143 /DNA_END=592 /DNA_ORIENTATION=+
MVFQRPPSYIAQYRLLEPRWEAIRRRSLSAMISPLRAQPWSARRAARWSGPRVGPGSYEFGAWPARRLRPDLLVRSWLPPPNDGAPSEHARGLYNPRPVDRALRGDPRPLMDAEADSALRRRRRSWAAGDGWRLYDPAPLPPPEGLASFS